MKNTIKLFGVIVFVLAAGVSFPGCDEFSGLPYVRFTVTIENNTSDEIMVYWMVSTQTGVDDSEHGYIYTAKYSYWQSGNIHTEGFDALNTPYRNSTRETIEYVNSINSIDKLSDLKIVSGETSKEYGPFRVAFKDDGTGLSAIKVGIKVVGSPNRYYYWGSDTPSSADGYRLTDVPGNFELVFDGEKLERKR